MIEKKNSPFDESSFFVFLYIVGVKIWNDERRGIR